MLSNENAKILSEAAPALNKWGGQEEFLRTTPIFYESHAHLEKEEPLQGFYHAKSN